MEGEEGELIAVKVDIDLLSVNQDSSLPGFITAIAYFDVFLSPHTPPCKLQTPFSQILYPYEELRL